jgi:putative ABC transport system permease protein
VTSTFRLALWNTVACRRRARSLALFTIIASGSTIGLLTVGDRAVEAQQSQVSAPSLRSVQVQPSPQGVGRSVLTAADLRQLSALPGVASVQPVLSTTVGIKGKPILGVVLNPTTPRSIALRPIVASITRHVFPLTGDEIILPAVTQGQNLRLLLGRSVTITLTPRQGDHGGLALATARVVAMYDPSWQVDGPDVAYASNATLLNWCATNAGVSRSAYLAGTGYRAFVVTSRSVGQTGALLRRIQNQGYYATSLLQLELGLPGVLRLLQLAGEIGAILLAILVLFGAASLASSSTRQRVREFALLRAVGYRRGQRLVPVPRR